MRTQKLFSAAVVVTISLSGCFQAEEELGVRSAQGDLQEAAQGQSTSTEVASGCAGGGGSVVSAIDEASAKARFQGRWLRCGAGTGRIEEASAFAREAAGFEVEGDRWFALEQRADGQWVRVVGEHSEGNLSWWTTNEVGVTFHSGDWMDPALMEFRSGGMRLNFYPGAPVLYVPL